MNNFKNIKKFITVGLSAIAAVSAMSVSAMAKETSINTSVYTDELQTMTDNNIIYTGDAESYASVNTAVFIMSNGEVSQITPIESDVAAEELNSSIIDDEVVITDISGNVVQISPLVVNGDESVELASFVYTKYTVTANNVNLRNLPGDGSVIMTLEKGVSFWSNSYNNIYRYGYVLSNGEKVFGAVSISYLKEA